MSPPLAGALLGRGRCCGRRGVGAKAAPVHWSSWEAAPPRAACVAAADVRAHAFDELCPQCRACDKSCVARGIWCRVVARPNWRPVGFRKLLRIGWRGGFVGTRRLLPVVVEASLTTPRARPPSAPTTLLRLKQTTQHVVIYTVERAKLRLLDVARHNKCFTHPLL